MPPRTAVALVNYNNVEDTANCVSSLMSSAEKPYLVVVDNSAQQSSLEKILKTYPGGTLIPSRSNIGFGRANNLAIGHILKNTDCEFVFFLNNDAAVEPDTIRLLEEAMDVYAEAGIVSPRILLMENPGLLWYGGGEVDWYRGKGKVPGYLGPADSPMALDSRNVAFVSGCALFLRRTVIERLGGFDPRFFIYEEDLELCLRVQEAGWKLRYVPKAVVLHRGQGSQRRRRDGFVSPRDPQNPNVAFFLYYAMQNRLLNMRLHARRSNLVRFLLGFPVFFFVDAVQYSVARRWEAVWAMSRGIQGFLRLTKHDPC